MSNPGSFVPLPPLRLNAPVYGVLLTVTTLLALIIVAHHPVADLHDRAQGLQNLVAIGAVDRWVHGALIAIVLLWAVGFSGFAWRLGIEHPAVMAGWLAYIVGGVFVVLAGLIDGFIVPDLADRLSDQVAHPAAYDLLALCGIANQALTKLGLVFMAVGILMWGHALMHHRGLARLMALFAMLTGGVSAAFILTSPERIDVHTLFWYLVGQVVWNLSVAMWMVRGMKSQAANTNGHKG